ncbi:MAG TPA: copper chaperone PCu(A)C [Rhizomicrobium sp.]
MRALLVSIFAATIAASAAQAADVSVSGGWFRALPGTLPAGGYFTLHNASDKPVTLNAVSSPACGMLMLHRSEKNGGTGMMVDMPSIRIAPKSDLVFTPGDYHLMCMNPTAAMKPSATVPVTLDFEGGAKLIAQFAVKDAKGQ